jgi:hypothetical protein
VKTKAMKAMASKKIVMKAAMKAVMKASMKTKAMKAAKAVAKNAAHDGIKVAKKPAAHLSQGNLALAQLKHMTLEEKMAHYQNNKKLSQDGNVDSFLNLLGPHDRQAIWQSFAYNRRASPEASEQYLTHCKGLLSDPKKKQLLHIFLTTGRNCKGKAYLDESTKVTFSQGTRSEEEWVPFAAILKKYGVAEALRRLKKGSINFRKDAQDPEELQFQDSRKISFCEHSVNQSSEMSRKGDMDLKNFLAAKGLTETPLAPLDKGSDQIQVFLQQQGLAASKKTDAVPAVEPDAGEDDDERDADADEDNDQRGSDLARQGEALSQTSSLASKKVGQRLQEMLKITNQMKSHIDCESMGKKLKPAMQSNLKRVVSALASSSNNLKKHMVTKVSMEKAKQVLTSSARAINDCKVFVSEVQNA